MIDTTHLVLEINFDKGINGQNMIFTFKWKNV